MKKTIVDDIISEFYYPLRRDIKQGVKNNMNKTLSKILKNETKFAEFCKKDPEKENKETDLFS